MNSWSKLCNTHCLFTLKTILIGHWSWNYVNKQWVLHNRHREFMLNKYDHSQNEKHKKEVTTVLVQTMFVLSISANRSTDRTIWTGDFIARQCRAYQIRILFLQLQSKQLVFKYCLSVCFTFPAQHCRS